MRNLSGGLTEHHRGVRSFVLLRVQVQILRGLWHQTDIGLGILILLHLLFKQSFGVLLECVWTEVVLTITAFEFGKQVLHFGVQ